MKYEINYSHGGAAPKPVPSRREFAIRIKNEIVPRSTEYFKILKNVHKEYIKIMEFDTKLLNDVPEIFNNIEIIDKFLVEISELNDFILDKNKSISDKNIKIDEYIKKYDDMMIYINKDRTDILIKQIEEINKKYGCKISDAELLRAEFGDSMGDVGGKCIDLRSREEEGSDEDDDFM